MLPVRWMAPECLMTGKFDTGGDAWSFGVMMFEVLSFGKVPYAQWTQEEVLRLVVKGERLQAPEGTPKELCDIFHLCFQSQRPTFTTLVERLEAVLAGLRDGGFSEDETEDGDIEAAETDHGASPSVASESVLDLESMTSDPSTTTTRTHTPRRISRLTEC